jgi:hypothetical protein
MHAVLYNNWAFTLSIIFNLSQFRLVHAGLFHDVFTNLLILFVEAARAYFALQVLEDTKHRFQLCFQGLIVNLNTFGLLLPYFLLFLNNFSFQRVAFLLQIV